MKKLLASLLLIISSVVIAQNITTLDPSQVYNTVNLVNDTTSPTNTTSTWQNIGLWNQGLPCWGPGGPVYCGPQPYYNNGSFNFSYGYTDVHQIVNIANALPNSGTGLRVNGFNFGFTAKNGNGWDNGQQDYLVAYVNFYDNNGNLARNYDYGAYTNRKYDWTTFNFSETFNTPYAAKDLSTARYGFVGYDTNFWAGPYGPEIYNVNFSLKYSVDPCYNNPLYSPTCPGFSDALAKLTSTSTTSPTAVTSTTTTPTTTITTTITADPVNPTVTVTSTPTTATQTTSQTQQNSSTKIDNSLALSVINKNQQREQNIANQAVQNAISTATASALASQQEALSVASTAVQNSTSSSISMSVGSSSIGLRLGSSQNSSVGIQVTDMMMSNESYNISYNNMLLDRTNPLNEYVEHKPNFSTGPTFSGPTVNRNVGNNEAAGGIDLTKMAIAPTGYNDYLNFTIKDVAFYQPKEVYKNQKNVDNARALRQLVNDNKHKEMVEMQYGK